MISVTPDLLTDYISVRKHTHDLCAHLHIEDYVPQAAEHASPPKWHLAHTTWFFEEMILKPHLIDYKEFDPKFGYLFNSYYNAFGERTLRSKRGTITRPTVKEVYNYRAFVDKHMLQLIESTQDKEQIELIILGLNHEQQHQELLLTDLKFMFGHNPIEPVYHSSFNLLQKSQKTQNLEHIQIEQGIYSIGALGNKFCYDNELGKHKVYIHKYRIATQLVTNGQYLEFINDNGYQRPNLWLDEGWAWINKKQIKSPLYWLKKEDQWTQFTLAGQKDIRAESPVSHISFYEASAFAHWAGKRLPTEFEWEAASSQFPWGLRWEWTSSAYLPYPYYTQSKGAVGEYNGKFMVNQKVLRGASVATSPNHSRKTYRNFFHPHFQWQYTGIRLAESL